MGTHFGGTHPTHPTFGGGGLVIYIYHAHTKRKNSILMS